MKTEKKAEVGAKGKAALATILANDPPREVTAKEDKAAGEVKTHKCPECGTMNPNSAVLCEVCGNKLYSKDSLAKEMQKKMFLLNKRLKDATTAGDVKLIKSVTATISKEVGKSDKAYQVDKKGYAVQMETTATKEKTERKPKGESHLCPCCGEKTKPGSYFKMGHDGRSHGMLLKAKLGKLEGKLNAALNSLFLVWKKSDYKMSMKESAIKAGL